MPSYASGELIEVLTREIKGLSSEFDAADYIDAAAQASRETGFSYPATTDFQTSWLIQRMKRALIHALLFDTAPKFRAKKYYLEQKFEHYMELIKKLDYDFYKALEEDPAAFAGVDSFKLFGTQADAGFAYDQLGRDKTYRADQPVLFKPTEND